MVNCCAYQCQSRSEKKEPGISFHSFPRDPERFKVWVNNLKLKDWTPTKNDRLCSKHFEEQLFYRSDNQVRVRLLSEAIPTIFPTLPKYLQPRKAKKRRYLGEDLNNLEQGPSTPLVRESETSKRELNKKNDPDSPRKQKLKKKLFKEVRKNEDHRRTIRRLKQALGSIYDGTQMVKIEDVDITEQFIDENGIHERQKYLRENTFSIDNTEEKNERMNHSTRKMNKTVHQEMNESTTTIKYEANEEVKTFFNVKTEEKNGHMNYSTSKMNHQI